MGIRSTVEFAVAAFFLAIALFGPAGCAAPNMFLHDGSRIPDAIQLESVHKIGLPGGGVCTGTSIDERTILTAKHCTGLVGEPYDTLRSGELHTNLDLLDRSEASDQATLVLQDGDAFDFESPVSFNHPPIGTEVYMVGYGCSGMLEVRKAAFAGYSPDIATEYGSGYMIFYGHACFGDSGGPVFDSDGNVVAIITNKAEDGTRPDLFSGVSPGRF